ncbi:hypothetical protein GCM10023063_24890 [Arthrobacter methylotrophus]|uniref:HNH endonuclease signature motif containing protein n=1 Tax=Arthrobacter methylotrophus TaxID=121291 RepID=A0ABV5UPM4_9MICC
MKTLRFRTLAIILPAAALLTLGTACSGPVAKLGIAGHGPTASAPAVPPPSAQESGVRQVHSPGAVAVDENLAPGQCAARVVDAAAGDVLPDPGCTPGAIDPAVSQDNIDSTICKAGYTATIRPPASATDKFKTTSLSAYGQSYERTTELDHLIPLELGGTNSASNLWPEPNRAGATGTTNPKDAVENTFHKAICNHTVKLADAQNAIAANWAGALKTLGL